MANLDFSIAERPIMDDSCYYCGTPIREKHVKIQFEFKRKMLLHLEPCWDQFYTGVSIIGAKLVEKVN